MSTELSQSPFTRAKFRAVHVLPVTPSADDSNLLKTRPSSLIERWHYQVMSCQWGDETVTRPVHIAPSSFSSFFFNGNNEKGPAAAVADAHPLLMCMLAGASVADHSAQAFQLLVEEEEVNIAAGMNG
ncbi:hypothetical protein PG985_004971 [Apiospora marii]|uniref:Uncharacterized protein n=1 Tax=Apiospora marii TaxID=335849 RepID=A0ABR1SAS7_9PEZI